MSTGRLIAVVMVALLVGALAVAGIGTALAWGPSNQAWGPFGDMMGGRGYGGMMGGYGPGPNGQCPGPGGMGGMYGPNAQRQGNPIGFEQAVQAVQGYVDGTGNGDLVVDEVMEFERNYYAVVVEKSTGVGAFELLVDKYTGNAFPEMGPNMMWNTKYGAMMHGGAMGHMRGWSWNGDAGPMTVSVEEARAAAQTWLDQYQPGSDTESPDQFYGYYTIHTLKDGEVTGMLSVNGYTGQVWYHGWHGTFVQMQELDE